MIHLVIPDQHAHPDHSNERFDWLGRLILDLKPDKVINIGDGGDFSSLSGYDKGKRSFVGRSYRRDLDSFLDGQNRIFEPIRRSKKRLPESFYFVGNHEQRIDKALDSSPELTGTLGIDDLDLKEWYDHVIPYEGGTPGVKEIDGIHYAHYFVSGVMGRSVSGEHPAYTLLSKQYASCTQGHTHVLDYAVRTAANGRKLHGLVCGVYQDYRSDWAGEVNDLWWSGVVIKREVTDGQYNAQFVSIAEMKKLYG